MKKVAALLQTNGHIAGRLGVGELRRSHIVVIDSGVSPSLVARQDFGRYLYRNPVLVLNPPKFLRNLEGQSSCWEHAKDGRRLASYGYVVDRAARNVCVGEDPLTLMAPPAAPENDPQYMPEHGGVVATVAVGGIDLMHAMPEMDRLLGVSFVRIMRESPNGVVADPTDVAEAIRYADERQATIITASLRIEDHEFEAVVQPLREFWRRGLVVASAGNSGGELIAGSGTFPASATTTAGEDGLMVVGGIQPSDSNGPPVAWPASAWSETLVDLVAPAVHIRAFDLGARESCYFGTSVAAPQVSFVAAVLNAYGYSSPALIKRRILATANELPDLAKKARSGRQLNVVHALDVFVDQIWLNGETEPLRVQLQSTEDLQVPGALIKVCEPTSSTDPLSASAGWIDPARLAYWKRRGPTDAEVWHEDAGAISPLETRCRIPDTALRYQLREGDIVVSRTVELSKVQRIVPTRLRPGIPIALEL